MAKRRDDPKHRRDDAGPREDVTREAQSRPSGGRGEAKSPIDKRHVDAPTKQKNARGHRTMPQRGR